jgi:hypothetical protein
MICDGSVPGVGFKHRFIRKISKLTKRILKIDQWHKACNFKFQGFMGIRPEGEIFQNFFSAR